MIPLIRCFAIAMFLFLSAYALKGQEALPIGTNPPAISFDHFPNRIYALVWRNWNLVTPARIAKTIGCKEEEINAIATSMGLPIAKPIPPNFKKQIYITIVRRNWHLLPYDQLLTLTDMSAEELEFSLREDDFLFHKLGNLKPKVSPLVYHTPDKDAITRAKEIKNSCNLNSVRTRSVLASLALIS